MAQANPPPDQPPPNGDVPWSLKGFFSFVQTIVNMVLDVFDIVVEPFFKINETGRAVRSFLFIIGFVLWWIFAYAAHPPELENIVPWFTFDPSDNLSTELMLTTVMAFQTFIQIAVALIAPFFAPDIFRHAIVIGLAGWIAYQWAGIYLDDIFELRDTKISRKFIRTAAFVGPLERVQIKDGEIAAKNKNSTVIKIGGPGRVLVHLENAALFEKINGKSHVILSEDRSVLLEGFERLRTIRDVAPKPVEGHAIFDRRDQFISSQTVKGRTKDGIIVTANDVSAVFSLHQGPVSSLEAYPSAGENGKSIPQIPRRISFDRDELEESIRHLVYNQTNRPWTDTAKGGIFPSIRTWIGQHTLDEFLPNLSPMEMAEIRQRLQDEIGTSGSSISDSSYLSRAEITNFMQGNPEDGKKRGYDVHWVGVGTWEAPDKIPEQYKEAFEISVNNRIQGSERELLSIQRESRLNELLRLLKEGPLKTFTDTLASINRKSVGMGLFQTGRGATEPPETEPKKSPSSNIVLDPKDAAIIKYQLILSYREKLKNARDGYERNQQAPPVELIAAIEHLSKFQPPT
jgi:hypothetical protein